MEQLLWLKGRARVLAGGSLSGAVDQLIGRGAAGRLGAIDYQGYGYGGVRRSQDDLVMR